MTAHQSDGKKLFASMNQRVELYCYEYQGEDATSRRLSLLCFERENESCSRCNSLNHAFERSCASFLDRWPATINANWVTMKVLQ